MVGPATLLGVLDLERDAYGFSERDVDGFLKDERISLVITQFSSFSFFCLILFVRLCSDT